MKKKLLIWKGLLLIMAFFVLLCNNSCTSEETNPEEVTPLSFSTPGIISPTTIGDKARIVITVSGGRPPYEFYIIPETQWASGDMMYDMLSQNNFSRLYRYTYTRNLFGSHTFIIEVAPGTPTVPKNYWVSVQDKDEKGPISGTNMLSWWRKVSAYSL